MVILGIVLLIIGLVVVNLSALVWYQAGTNTTLAVQLDPGATTVTLTSSAGWSNAAGANAHYRSLNRPSADLVGSRPELFRMNSARVLKASSSSATSDGFAHATAQKEFNTFWLTMTQEFNRQLKGTDADFRASFMAEIAQAVQGVIAEVPDPGIQKRMRARLVDSFEERGL